MEEDHRLCGLSQELISQIVGLIIKHKPLEKIVVFGSRAEKTFKYNSDIDIAIFARDWTDRDINIVKFNLDEDIKTPLKFDVLNFYAISKESLKEKILKRGRIIYDSGKS